jgi:hypothetical protein
METFEKTDDGKRQEAVDYYNEQDAESDDSDGSEFELPEDQEAKVFRLVRLIYKIAKKELDAKKQELGDNSEVYMQMLLFLDFETKRYICRISRNGPQTDELQYQMQQSQTCKDQNRD